MKLPLSPPKYDRLAKKIIMNFAGDRIIQLMAQAKPVTSKGEYAHWEKVRHLKPPAGFSSEEWWFSIKSARNNLYKSLPFKDKSGNPLLLATPDIVLQLLHIVDRKAGDAKPILSSNMRDNYLVRAYTEEAITSSQLEGASTTRKVAKEMLQTGRKPKDKNEQMIFNNYRAMQFIQEFKDETLTPQMILELHHILTEDTLDDPETAGTLRTTNDVHVYDNSDGTLLHTPPSAKELKDRLQKMCDFANNTLEEEYFMHPVVKAILLHFVLAYDHPFVDGNGRTARALFYWSMANQQYSFMGFISISKILKEMPGQYAKAFLHTETDDNDVTYFVIHQLNIILKAIELLNTYLDEQNRLLNAMDNILHVNKKLEENLNYRQIALLRHALSHSNFHYQISVHRQSHNITYQTARTDLLQLEKLKLLQKKNIGKAFNYIVPSDLEKRLKNLK